MKLTRHQKAHAAWAIICTYFTDMCFEYSYTFYPMNIFGTADPIEVFHPAVIPPEYLPLVLLTWILGHITIIVLERRRQV